MARGFHGLKASPDFFWRPSRLGDILRPARTLSAVFDNSSFTGEPMSDQEFKYDVFLRTEANKAWVRELFEHLRDEGVKVFFADETMPPGANIPLGVMDALRESRKVAIVMTPAYFAKTWPRAEFASILSKDPENKERRLIPLLRESCEAPDLISPLKSIDFTNDHDFHLRLRQLVEALDLPRLKFAETRFDPVEEDFDFRERRINDPDRLRRVKGKLFQDEIAILFELLGDQVERKQLLHDKGGGRAAGLVVQHSIPFTGEFV